MSSYSYVAHGYRFPKIKTWRNGSDPLLSKAGIGRENTQLLRTVTQIAVWGRCPRTGGVSGLLDAFKAFSKTELVNIPEMCRLKPYLCSHRGITGREGLFETLGENLMTAHPNHKYTRDHALEWRAMLRNPGNGKRPPSMKQLEINLGLPRNTIQAVLERYGV